MHPGIIVLGGGVKAYPVMQAYRSLALEDNLEVNEAVLDRYSFPVSALVPSISQPKMQTNRSMGLSRRYFGNFPPLWFDSRKY